MIRFFIIFIIGVSVGYGWRIHDEKMTAKKVFYDQQYVEYMEKIKSYVPPGYEIPHKTKNSNLKRKRKNAQ